MFLNTLAAESPNRLRVNDAISVHLDPAPERMAFSTYTQGDIFHHLDNGMETPAAATCPVGMATVAYLRDHCFFTVE
jgi:hypothetical protein